MRWMSPREYARLQGAGEFPLKVDRNQALYGFGDAVCVPVISWIAEHALSQLVSSGGAPKQATDARATMSGALLKRRSH